MVCRTRCFYILGAYFNFLKILNIRMQLNLSSIFLMIALVIFFMVGFNCGKGCARVRVVNPPQPKIKTDTIYQKQKRDTEYIPKLDTIYKPTLAYKYDTTYIQLMPYIDTAYILKDYFAKAIYKDTQSVKYGKIIITDTITQNRIASRKLTTDLNIPTITKQVILTQPKRSLLSITLAGQYYQGVNMLGVGGGLQFKLRSDMAFGAKVLVDTKGQRIYQGELIYPIKFKKQ